MKTQHIFAAMAVLVIASCTKNEIQEDGSISAPAITASIHSDSPGVKTSIYVDQEGVGTIFWQPGDRVNIFFGTTSVPYTSTNTEPATTVVFNTTAMIGSTESASTNRWGLYPYDEEATCDGSSVITTIPSVQYAVSETFDNETFTMLGHSADNLITFYNVCGGIKFSFSRDDIEKITFKGNNNEDLAGKVKLEMDDEGRPKATVVEGQKTITLTPKTGTTFASGTNYYIITLPVSLAQGFTMTFETFDEIGTFDYSEKSVVVKRSTFSKKANIDSYAAFTKKPIDITDLSENGAANCYIIPNAGAYKFKTVRGNSIISVGDVKGVKVLWESFGTYTVPEVGEIIKSDVGYKDGYIYFSTNDTYKRGNAVIAAYSDSDCTDDNILWSWHIWCSGISAGEMIAQTWNNVGDMLDRNLGAISKDIDYGDVSCLMYQKHRKDPFLGGCFANKTNNNTPEYTRIVANIDWPTVESGTFSYEQLNSKPTTFVSGSLPTGGWAENEKGLMDPCPPGYRIPCSYYYVALLGEIQMSESPYRSVAHYGTALYANGYNDLWFPYTKKLTFSNEWKNEYSEHYADGIVWTVGSNFLHRIYDGEMYPYYSGYVGGAAVRCVKEDSPEIIMVRSLDFDTDSVTIEPYGSFTITPILSPVNTSFKRIDWLLPSGFEKSENLDGSFTITNTSGNLGKYNIYAKSSLEHTYSTINALTASANVNVFPAEPKGTGYGGWYISAKAGDTFSFHIKVGTSDDGQNYYSIYLGDNKISDQGPYTSSGYQDDFSYLFSEPYTGWLYITVGWGFEVSNITTTASVLGRGNTWGLDVDLRMYDSWKNGTPKYIFTYENQSLTIY